MSHPDDDPIEGVSPDGAAPDESDGDNGPDDAAWQAIVANFGDRAELTGDELKVTPREEPPEAFVVDERFVPPDPGPVRLPDPPRLLAWAGVLGAPMLLFAIVAFEIGLPALLSTLVVLWFLGGFAYLVTTMPNDPPEPWDDGATL